MKYEQFREFVEENMIVPDEDQKRKFFHAPQTTHLCLVITDESVDALDDKYDLFVFLVGAIEERGAVAGEDYIVCSGITKKSAERGGFEVQLHALSSYISINDDFPEGTNIINE